MENENTNVENSNIQEVSTNDTVQEESQKKLTFLEKVFKKKEIVVCIYGALIAIYPILNVLYNVLYQNSCEKFYHIPRQYFSSDIKYSIVYLFLIIIIVAMCGFPIFIRKLGAGKQTAIIPTISFAFLLGMCIGIINIYNLIELLRYLNFDSEFNRNIVLFINENAEVIVFIIIILAIISVVSITILDILKNRKNKVLNCILGVLFITSFFVSSMLMLYGTMAKLSVDISKKTQYEFVSIDDKTYAVLSEYDDKILVVEFEISDGRCILITESYQFIEKYTGVYTYIDMSLPPLIQSDVE